MSLYQDLLKRRQSEKAVFHMPGHKYGAAGLKERYLNYSSSLLDIDTTEISGTDNLYDANGIIKDAQDRAKAFYSAEETHFLINGSTGGIMAMILGAFKRGDKIVISREAHRSVHHAIQLGGLEPIYVMPVISNQGVILGADVPAIRQIFETTEDLKGIVITYPSYSGACADLEAIVECVHAFGGLVLVDEAHGAHLPLSNTLPKSALSLGADVVVQSVHKTLPAMTQTALMHFGTNRANRSRIKHYLSVLQSSSPSYVLMTSIDEAVSIAKERKLEGIEPLLMEIDKVRMISREIGFFCLEDYGAVDGFVWDRMKVCLSCGYYSALGYNAYDLERALADKGIVAEYVVESHVLLMMTISTEASELGYLKQSLEAIGLKWRLENELESLENLHRLEIHEMGQTIWPKTALQVLPYKAVELDFEWISIDDAVGRVVSDYIVPYPPGIPLLMPGEVMSDEILKIVHSYFTNGHTVLGVEERRLRVIMDTV